MRAPTRSARASSELNTFINANAGRLPAAAVVTPAGSRTRSARSSTPREVRPLDIYAVLLGQGHRRATTCRRRCAATWPWTATCATRRRASGRTPTQSLLEQLDALQESASATLVAARNQDADALMTQGNFLRTKFSGSDLDL